MISNTRTSWWIMGKFADEQPLSVDEEFVLFQEIKRGNRCAKEKLIKANMRFVIQTANSFKGCGLDTEELIDEGAIGLLQAIEHFDSSRGLRFITYAVWWIRACIIRAITDKGSLVRLPVNQHARLSRSKKEFSTDQMEEELRILREKLSCPVSLDAPIDSNDSTKNTLLDSLQDSACETADERINNEFRKDFTQKFLQKLPKRERETIEHLYGINTEAKNVYETSCVLKISKERIRQLKKQALKRMFNFNADGFYNTTIRELYT